MKEKFTLAERIRVTSELEAVSRSIFWAGDSRFGKSLEGDLHDCRKQLFEIAKRLKKLAGRK